MGYAQLAERRYTQRKDLNGKVPGEFQIAGVHSPIECRALDVSEKGVGIVSQHFMSPGTKVQFKSIDREIDLEVVWRQDDIDHPQTYFYGLVVLDDLDIEKIFQETGCIESS